MQDILLQKLHAYLCENNPDLLVALQEEGRVSVYLQERIESVELLLSELQAEHKPAYITEEVCMAEMTADLKPSKFNYVSRVMSAEFETDYYRLKEHGVLTYELINMVRECEPVFDLFGFTEENEDDRGLYYAVTGTVSGYLTNNK